MVQREGGSWRDKASHRVVQGLRVVKLSDANKWSYLRRRNAHKKGTCQAKGLAYQRKVLRKIEDLMFPRLESVTLWGNLWIEYEDALGVGVCNPDIVIECDDRILVLECKLTQTDVAEHQIAQLYAPCLRFMWAKPILGVGVFRNLLRQPKNPVRGIEGLLTKPLIDCDVFSTWHLTL